ncbi:hypothetical protein ACN47E_009533 [Coniothyrium glycines]
MSSHTSDQRGLVGYNTTPIGQRKVAIPRLQKVGQANDAAKDRRRVPRACTGCRSHKIKCTGDRPSCKHCSTTSRECVYIMPRKDRLKIVTERCHEMALILRAMSKTTNGPTNPRIADILEAVEEDVSELRETMVLSNSDFDSHGSPGNRESSITDPDDELIAESMDMLDENLHEDEQARATGFIGKSSEVQWLRTVAIAQNETSDGESNGIAPARRASNSPSSEQVNSFSFWTDGESLEMDAYIDPYGLPSPEIAERLLQCYMLKVHDSFPILPRKLFESQFRIYFRALQSGNAPRLSSKWQAILNLVFAIGAKYTSLVKAPWQADARDHLIYHSRARFFGLNETTIMNHADIPQTQSLGLLAFYWLSVGQVNRAWIAIGMALRSAYALGLHVRNEDPSATATKRETLVRTWWSLYSLERTLSIVTGRPSIIVDSCCSVPLPLPVGNENISEEVDAAYRLRQRDSICNGAFLSSTFSKSSSSLDLSTPTGIVEANGGSYFNASVRLSIIVQSILTTLYSAGTMIRSPVEIQQHIVQLSDRLDQWVVSLPPEFRPDTVHNQPTDSFARERMLLVFQFCSARILLTRPCLTRRRRKETNESGFAKRMANMCVDAAKSIMTALPDVPEPDMIYESGPWWCIVHHLMQSMSVFLLALSFPSSTAYPSMDLVYSAKKALRWLQAMQDPVAERAYVIGLNSLQGAARQHGIDIAELWLFEADGVVSTRSPQQDIPHTVQGTVLDPYLHTQFGHISHLPHIMDPTYAAYDSLVIDSSLAPYPPHQPVFGEERYVGH